MCERVTLPNGSVAIVCSRNHHRRARGMSVFDLPPARASPFPPPAGDVVGTIADPGPALRQLVVEQGAMPMRVVKVLADGTALAKVEGCPCCHRQLDPKRRCWKCCVAVCACGAVSSSAFITVCRRCEVEEYRRNGQPY